MKIRFALVTVALALCLPAADLQAQNGIARGKVVDEKGEPVAGAAVALEYLGRLVHQEPGASADAERTYETETDDEGQFTQIVDPGHYRITASKEGYRGAGREQAIRPGTQTRVSDLQIVNLKAARAAAVDEHEVLGPLKRAMDLTQAGQLEEAEVAYLEVLSKDPHRVEALYNLGIIYLERKDYTAAGEQLSTLVAVSPETSEAYPALSRSYAEQGDDERALEVMARGTALDPDNAQMQFNLGVLYYNAQRTAEAEETLLRAVELNPANVRIHYMLGNLALNRSDLEEAAARFEKFLAEAPEGDPYRQTANDLLEQLRPAPSPES